MSEPCKTFLVKKNNCKAVFKERALYAIRSRFPNKNNEGNIIDQLSPIVDIYMLMPKIFLKILMIIIKFV